MILYISIIALIIILVAGMVWALRANAEAERRKRVMHVVSGTSSHVHKDKKAGSQDQRRADLAKKLKDSKEEGKEKKGNTLSQMIMQAGLHISVRRFWLLSAGFAAVMTVGAFIMQFSTFVVAMVAITSLLGLPKMALKMMATSRQKKFLTDFADALDAMTRLLRAGMPVTEAIKMVAREYTGPVGEEMDRIFDQQKIGIPLPEAVLNGARRMPIPEMKMFATAVAIQSQTGSSLSEVLENLATVIRGRFRLKRKVQALSSEAKASAMIIGALPNLVGLGLYFLNHDYIILLFIDPTGKMMLGGAVFWMCVGILVMRQMINFKV